MPEFIPVLSCAESRAFEETFFAGDTDRALAVMREAGAAVAQEALSAPGAHDRKTALILFGKGANAADALFAAHHLSSAGIRCHLHAVFDRRHWSAPVRTAHDELIREHPATVVHAHADRLLQIGAALLVIDGITGSGFRPPLSAGIHDIIRLVNEAGPRRPFVVSVDLPSGVGEPSDSTRIRADMTVATGILKRPLLTDESARAAAGRIRFADLGFYRTTPRAEELVVSREILHPLRDPIPADADKRSRGKLAIFGGAPHLPGALLLNTHAALLAGAGLVTAHAPASVQPAFAAAAPEAMWVPVPESSGVVLWEKLIPGFLRTGHRFDAVVCGSGMADTPQAAEFARTLIRDYPGKLLLDADALRPEILVTLADRPPAFASVTLTPHAGEFRRITGATADFDALRRYADTSRATVVLKGPGTRVAAPGCVAMIPFGGPALARGGTGDLLAGIIGALLAREAGPGFDTVCRAVAWHGFAADHLASEHGETAIRTTDLLDALHLCLKQPAPKSPRVM